MIARSSIPSGVLLLAFIALALLLHAPVLGLSFFSDDFSVIHRIGVQGELGTGSFFRPLPDWTLYLNYLLAGPVPWTFRIVNVVLLGINAWLVYRLGQNLIAVDTGSRRAVPLLAGLFFVCYPFHSEPQVWIIGRSTAMASLFTLSALVIATSEMRRSWKCLFVGLLGALGAMCYESALLLPFFLAVLVFVTPKGQRRTLIALVVIALAVAGSNLLLRSILTGQVANEYGSAFFSRDPLSYLVMATKVLARLLLPPHPGWASSTWLVCAATVLVLVVAYLLFRRTRDERTSRHLLIAFLALTMIACAIGIVGGVSTRTSESDRFLYLPSAFLCLFIAFALHVLLAGRWRIAITTSLLVVWLFFLFGGQLKWIKASEVIERIVVELPSAPAKGRLVVMGLPGDNQGAFMFRHGFREALLFAGHDTARIIPIDSLLIESTGHGLNFFMQTADDTLALGPADRIVSWSNQKGFIDTP